MKTFLLGVLCGWALTWVLMRGYEDTPPGNGL